MTKHKHEVKSPPLHSHYTTKWLLDRMRTSKFSARTSCNRIAKNSQTDRTVKQKQKTVWRMCARDCNVGLCCRWLGGCAPNNQPVTTGRCYAHGARPHIAYHHTSHIHTSHIFWSASIYKEDCLLLFFGCQDKRYRRDIKWHRHA